MDKNTDMGVKSESCQLGDAFPSSFPVELERAIFEDAAHLSRHSIPTFMLVAHRVKEWMEPQLYSIVIAHQSSRCPKGYTPPIDRIESYAHHVRHFLVYSVRNFGFDQLIKHLTLCTNLIDVGLWVPHQDPQIFTTLSSLPLQRLSGYLSRIWPDISTQIGGVQTPFLGLTHLELLDSDITWSSIKWLTNLENLTHLSLQGSPSSELVQKIFASCNNLRLIIQEGQKELSGDNRVVHVSPQLTHSTYSEDWLCQARCEHAFWDIAEEMVNRRQREDIESGDDTVAMLSILNEMLRH
ncbi:hypothetical protein BDN72DRAFT_963323 [Pluteus cervinus]|uniref:Uncharacterized protein n=1 Tax=Pluteus cervinus TaxID=181527 RepID=A0ACD3AHE4_9AGAR|nr:hypothetical protein BDN72DRAFT_963323 [Pluteus cervinus]